ncbi:MAG: WecB/TagA/CpsF family glycosyltransferase, partial [Candidatus Omnitrophica bacterium]|nr:WecB/TagA/CpsF family glycosyltransferase [Candidatus Omnitrophota bacterium]
MIKVRKRFQKVNICGTDIDNVSMEEVLQAIERYIRAGSCEYVVTPNVDHLIKLREDEEFRRIYADSAIRIPDGMPLIWASRYLKTPLRQKVSGSDLVLEICKLSDYKGYRLFFLGGEPPAAQLAKEKLETQFKSIQICGVYSPPFGFEYDKAENQKIVQMIKEVKPDILLVGLGAPKQEKWINRYYKELEVPVSIGVGITFGFISGMVKRAPIWMQKKGLEWLWRLLNEPKRLWKRYLLEDMRIFWLVFQQKRQFLTKRSFKIIHSEVGEAGYKTRA